MEGIGLKGFDETDQRLTNLIVSECDLSHNEALRIVANMTDKEKEQGLTTPELLQELIEQIYERMMVRLQKEDDRRNSW